MPLAAPRESAGTLFMMAVVLGAEYMPEPIPFSTSSAVNAQ